MSNKTKTKKFRGSGWHGRGQKKGRGKGLRGGSGNAGLHKHKFTLTLLKEKAGIQMFGRVGFKRPTGQVFRDATINVGDLAETFPGKSQLNLSEHGFTKLLGAGDVPGAVQVTVEAASAQAIEKIAAKGGKVTTTRPRVEKVKKVAPPAKGAPAPAAKPAKEPKAAKEQKPGGAPKGAPAGGPPSAPPKKP